MPNSGVTAGSINANITVDTQEDYSSSNGSDGILLLAEQGANNITISNTVALSDSAVSKPSRSSSNSSIGSLQIPSNSSTSAVMIFKIGGY